MLDLGVQLATLAAAGAVMTCAWLVSLPLRDASVADIAWGPVFVAIAWTAYLAGEGAGELSLLIAVLITIWGLRLSSYIAWRHDGEDKRYAAMRERAGSGFALRSLLTVFLLQAAIAWVVSAPIQATAADPVAQGLGALAIAGAALTLFGITFEAVADYQLSRFLADRDESGRSVLDDGLWRYSRHPNYFGNATLWFGIWLIALETGSSAAWTVIGPLLMTFFLLRVSGVALTERNVKRSRPGYADYIKRTSAFVPLPPRRRG